MNVKPGDASTSGERPDLVSSSEYQDFFGDGSTYGLHDVYLACGVLKQVQHDISVPAGSLIEDPAVVQSQS